jgi:signal transduction histidine kinase
MSTSISVRMILGINLLVIAVAVVLGTLASGIASEAVEQRLVREVARNTAAFLQEESYPLSDTMMSKLKRMFDLDFVAVETAGGQVAGSTVCEAATQAVLEEASSGDRDGQVQLQGRFVRFASQPVTRQDPTGGATYRWNLYALAGAEQFEQTSRRVEGRVAWIALLAAGGATVLAAGLSWTVSRPIRRLADRMDALAENPDQLSSPQVAGSGPRELVRLRKSFLHLLEQLEIARKGLARSQQLAVLGKLSASVAHELRNPLSGVKMHLRLLREEVPPGAARESLETVAREADRMELYLNDLMELASTAREDLSDQMLRSHRTTCRPGEVIESVLALMRPRLDHAGISLEVQTQQDPPQAAIEERRLRQVLLNLLVNAVEAMQGGGHLRLELSSPNEAQVRIDVLDSGRGVQEEQAEQIFEPFVSTRPDSAGLGLYICRRIVQAAGGTLRVEPGSQGGHFVLLLPTRPVPAENQRHG